MVGVIAGVAGVASAGIGALSASSAADKSASAANNAANLQAQQAAAAAARLKPYTDIGVDAAQQLDGLNKTGFTAGQPNYLSMAAGAVPNANTMAGVVNTPGYQFNLAQGLESTQNAAAARGLGVSGAALKGAATYATGLADSTYQNQFADQQTDQQDFMGLNSGQQGNATNLYNRLSGTASIGENAGAETGAQGIQATNAAANSLIAGGNAQAAGALGVGNAITGNINSGVNNYLQYQGYTNGIYGSGGAAPSGSGNYVGAGTDPSSSFGI